MFNKKLDKTDLQELRKREELINQHVLTAQALEAQKKTFILSRFAKYRLDITKEYSFDLRTAKIREVKPQSPKAIN